MWPVSLFFLKYIYIYIYIIIIMSCRLHGYLWHSLYFSLLSIVSGRSSGLHPVSSHSCCMYVLAGRPALARPYVGVHRSTSRMSSSLPPPAVSCVPGLSNLTDKMKRSFSQAAVVSILLYGCTTWTLTKRLEKKLDGNNTRILRAILNNSWRQHPTKHQLYSHLPPITKTIYIYIISQNN